MDEGIGPKVATIAGATVAMALVVAGLERVAGVANGSPAFILAVVVVAVLQGTWPAVVTAVGAFLVYDFFFIEPLYTFTVNDPAEWLNLILLLVVGVVVGQLAGRERERRITALEGEREAMALFNVSFTISTERNLAAALPTIARMVRDEIRAARVWVVVGGTIVADTAPGRQPASGRTRPCTPRSAADPGDEPAEWVRVHAPKRRRRLRRARRKCLRRGDRGRRPVLGADLGDPPARARGPGPRGAARPGRRRGPDRRARSSGSGWGREATTAEISRRSDALKSALLDSVSHDLRTPLASIRAAAGTLMDPDIDWPPDAAARDRGVDRSRGRVAEPPGHEPARHEPRSRPASFAQPGRLGLGDAVDEAIHRDADGAGRSAARGRLPADLPPVLADEVFLGQVLANTLDNAAKYAGPGVPVRVSAAEIGDVVRITIEDGGAGVPPTRCPACSRSSTACHGRARARGAGPGSAWPWSVASSRRWAATVAAGEASSAASRSTSTCRSPCDLRVPGRRGRHGPMRPPSDGTTTPRPSCSSRTTRRPAMRRDVPAGARRTRSRGGRRGTSIAAWTSHRPDLIVLDLGLPDQDGLT